MDILVTKRLTLRPPLEVDAEAITMALDNFNVSKNMSQVPHPYRMKDAVDWIGKDHNPGCRFTIHREKLLGVVQVRPADKKPAISSAIPALNPVLGYWLSEASWGKGYMSEACRAVLAYAFRFYDADAIDSYAAADNAPSLKVMEKLGFDHIGETSRTLQARGTTVPTIETSLTRSRFEQMFGSLETNVAA